MLIAHIHEFNSIQCFFLSLEFNLILIGLVLWKSPPEMRNYKHIILHTAIVDMALAVLMELVQPIFFSYSGGMVFYLNGPFVGKVDSTLFQFMVLELTCLVFFFAMFGQCAQFISQHHLVTKGRPISRCRYFSLLLVPLVIVLGICYLLFIIGYPSPQNAFITDPHVIELLSDGNSSLRVAQYVDPLNPLKAHIVADVLVAYLLAIGVNGYCSYRMVRHMHSSASKLSAGAPNSLELKLSRQITRSLFILGTLPLGTLCFMLLIAGLSYLLPDESKNNTLALSVEMLATVPEHWLSVVNPLVTIITIKPYWNTLTGMLGKMLPCFRRNNTTATTSPVVQIKQQQQAVVPQPAPINVTSYRNSLTPQCGPPQMGSSCLVPH